MRRTGRWLFIAALSAPLGASLHAAPNDVIGSYPVDEVAANVFVMTGPLGEPSVANQGFMNNPAWIVTRDGVVVIDPGSSVQAGRRVLKEIGKITGKPVTHVFTTHIHGDHWLGNHAILEVWPQAKLVAHPDMIAKAHAGEAQSWVALMSRLTEGYTDGTRAHIPTVAAADGQLFKVGERRFKVHSVNDAHSKTDLMIEVDGGILFTGDIVLNGRVARMDDGLFQGTIRAIDRAVSVPAKTIVPGHGKTGGRGLLTAQREYLQTLFDAVRIEYDTGKADFEMKAAIVEKLAKFRHWHGFDAAVGRHISLAILEIERQ